MKINIFASVEIDAENRMYNKLCIKYIGALFVYLLFLSGCSQKLVRTYRNSDLFNNHFSGVVIKDLRKNKTIIDINGNKLFTPASNTKLLTFYVTDKVIQDYLPSFKFCVWNDTAYFSGMGDPTLLHPDFKDQSAFKVLRDSPHPLAYSSPPISDERYGPGWAWDDFPYYFQPEKSAMPLYGNSLWIKKEKWGALEVFPSRFDVKITIDTALIKLKTGRNELENIFNLSYFLMPESVNRSVPFRVSDSVVLSLLSDTLKKEVLIKEFPVFCNTEIIYSQHKDSVYKKLLVESDNFMAEQLLLSGSSLLFDTLSSQKFIDDALDVHFSRWKESISWIDGSGLSRYNMMTPEFYVFLLEKIYSENSWERIVDLFPDGGSEGTMKNFLKAPAPYVFAKSGSMTGVYNLSGYLLTDKGNILVFSLMNNNFNSSFTELKAEIEKFLIVVKKSY